MAQDDESDSKSDSEKSTKSDSEKSTDWAEFRTDLAEDRTIQATERTFAGWLRTAFAAIGVGIAFHVVFGEFQPPWLAQAIASLFIVLGISVAYTAEKRASSTFVRLSSHEIDRPKIPNIRWMSWSIIAGGVALIAGIWILNDGSISQNG